MTPNGRSRDEGLRSSTHCIRVKDVVRSTATTGATVVSPSRPSCRAVLYLLMVVGRTSAEGREKSQYLAKVFGGGSEIHR